MILLPNSFGNIAAAAHLTHLIYKALRDSAGSSSDYKSLIEELRAFEDALLLVHRAILAVPVSESDRQNIIAETTRCLKLLAKFWGRIERYEVVLSGKWTAIWRKIVWATWKADEVSTFKRKVSQHQQNIAMFLIGLNLATTLCVYRPPETDNERRELHSIAPFFGVHEELTWKEAEKD